MTLTTAQPITVAAEASRRVWPIGLAAAAAGATVAAAYAAILDAAGVPMQAGGIGASHAEAVTPLNFAFGVALCTAIATAIAAVLVRRSHQPLRRFVLTTVTLTAVSLVTPFAAAHTAASTKVTFAIGHLLAATVVIPIFARRLRSAAVTGS